LLEPAGFKIDKVVGIGPRSLYRTDEILRWVRRRIGDWFAVPLLVFMLPLVRWAKFDPDMPYSLYVRAEKPRG